MKTPRPLRGWVPTIPIGRRTRITHYVKYRTRTADVVFFTNVPGWLGNWGELRFP